MSALTRRLLLASGAFSLFAGTARSHNGTVHVMIDKLLFAPAEVTASVGNMIEWINNDSIAHTATVKGGWEVMIPPGKSATKVMETAGTIDYYCRFHPNMKGRIVVT